MVEFSAALKRITRDHENYTTLTLECDAQQLDLVMSLPAQKLLTVSVTWEGEDHAEC